MIVKYNSIYLFIYFNGGRRMSECSPVQMDVISKPAPLFMKGAKSLL